MSEDIKTMVDDMETVEGFLKSKGRFVGDMVHVGIADLAQVIRAQHPTAGDGDVKKRRDIALKGLSILRQASYGEDITITAKDKAYRDVRTYIHLSAFEQAEHPAPPCEALEALDEAVRMLKGGYKGNACSHAHGMNAAEAFIIDNENLLRTALLAQQARPAVDVRVHKKPEPAEIPLGAFPICHCGKPSVPGSILQLCVEHSGIAGSGSREIEAEVDGD